MLSARQAGGGDEQPAADSVQSAGGRAARNGYNEPESKQQIVAGAGQHNRLPASNDTNGAGLGQSPLRPLGSSPPVGTVGEALEQQSALTKSIGDTDERLIGAIRTSQRQGDANREAEDQDGEAPNEKSRFIESGNWPAGRAGPKQNEPVQKLRAQLAKQESISERSPTAAANQVQFDDDNDKEREKRRKRKKREAAAASEDENGDCCSRMLRVVRARKCLSILIVILVIYIAVIYCLPSVEINPDVPNQLPAIPFDFQQGPLRPSSASAYKFKHLFKDQIHGPESLAFDSQGNLYMAIEGGFILYAHLNKSSPMKRAYVESSTAAALNPFGQPLQQPMPPELIKIAELNGPRQFVSSTRTRGGRPESEWRRECQLDEKVYGQQLFEVDRATGSFKSKVLISRCSKPLGIRLNADETQLYVIDTLAGLFRVDLRQTDQKQRYARASQQRQVLKLIDFKANNGRHVLPAIQLEDEPEQAAPSDDVQATRLMNVSMKALDDLAIDRPVGSQNDLIFMTVASQSWPATSFVFDALEGRPSGLVLRYNTANSQLVVLEPSRVALVRTSTLKPRSDMAELRQNQTLFAGRSHQPSFLLGAPQMDENDVFDDRPLNFPNGLELTDDRQALLIADTSNKRIVRHYIRGPRRGTSDLWAWTPMFPDNIRRGQDRSHETYWVVGCGRAKTDTAGEWFHYDPFELLRTWPRLRKFLLKNLYFMGYLVELMGENVLQSTWLQDAGYGLRTGSTLCQNGCTGMMIIQYNKHGDIIRSVHSREFPDDLYYYSQVNELIDAESQEHSLYLGSPSYNYLTKLTLPSETQVLTNTNHQSALLANNELNTNQINNDYMR